ncbi:Glutamate-1-semialdehyde 2,1-aminomutase [Alphaproteobacteria bacterium SO-S41]|nr:Glutamate-1-semialdehyde 2,1-aminomutase [Alphaproteobacteria bacterium SO-S41]
MATKPAAKSASPIVLDRSNQHYPDLESRSAGLFERAVKVLPGGNSRMTVFHLPYPVYAARAQGSRVWDVDGVERIDFINNLSSLVHGHNHPEIVKAIQAQAATLASMSMPTEKEVDLAEVITGRVAGIDRIRFTNSGTEGVMMAIKTARAFTGRDKIAKIEGAYHGGDDAVAVSVNPSPALWGEADAPASVPVSGTGRGAASDTIVLPMNQVEAARAIIRRHASELAGVILDPVVKNLGYKPATKAFAQMLREECDAAGALLIFDEVYSFRLGYHGAQGELGVTPDLTALGKLIGGGLPVGATGGKAHVMEAVYDARNGAPKLSHGGTFNANPMTMAAGLVAMRLWDEEAVAHVARLGDRLRNGLREVLKIADAPGRVGGVASMISFFHSEGVVETYRDAVELFKANPGMHARSDAFFKHMLNSGIIMASHGFFVLSTAHTDDEIDFLLEQALSALRKMG